MEYKIEWGYGKKYGITLWYHPETGEIIDWTKYKTLNKEDKKKYVKAGKFKCYRCLVIVNCPKDRKWHEVPFIYNDTFRHALEKCKDCEEFKKFIKLYNRNKTLAKLYVYNKLNEEKFLKIIKLWINKNLHSYFGEVLKEIFELLPEYSNHKNEIMSYYSKKLITRNLKG